MIRKKFAKFGLILILLFGILWCIFSNITEGSSSDEFVALAKQSYDYVISHIYSGNGGYGTASVTGTFSNYAYNIPCMYLNQNTNISGGTTGLQELLGYALISSDGTVEVYTYNASTDESTLSKTITNQKTTFQNTARMCYYVTIEKGGADYYVDSSYFTGGEIGSGDTSGTWYQLIGWYNQYASTLGWSTSWLSGHSDRESVTLSTSSGPWALAVANPEKITCEAIILYYGTHGQQSTIMCIGKVGDSGPGIDKYITQTTYNSSISDRSGKTNGSSGEKYADPVKVAPGEEVEYTIKIENKSSSSIEVDLTDTFASCFSYVSSTAEFTWTESSDKNEISASDVTVTTSGLEFTVTLKVSETATISSTPRKNTITLTYKEKDYSADDYILVDPRNYCEKIYILRKFTRI